MSETERVYFNAVLYPNRSLGRRGFLIVMAIVLVTSVGMSLLYLQRGAWPIVVFYVLDVALIYLAFRLSYRQGRLRETLHLTARALTVTRTDPAGRSQTWTFEPTWLRVDMDNPPRHESQLVLTSRGQRLIIAAFLSPDERGEVAEALLEALREMERG